jgi:UDP-N-acetylmuramyl pentapeptide phosphotransferase/UDP-N-acetylglucosamine-1-phosphate transferase
VSVLAQDWLTAGAIAAATCLFVFALLKPLIDWLRRRAIMDIPNDRSSHVEVTPRGGGIATTAGILLGCMAWSFLVHGDYYLLALVATTGLALVSWLDDRRGGLPVGIRLGAQMLAVGLMLMVLPDLFSVTQGALPLWLERILLFFAWLWFTNLFNFMDGINGITGIEMATLGIGVTVIGAVRSADGSADAIGLIVAAAALGFLPWNWGRAKVFLGDVGSVPAGYLIGLLLVLLACSGDWAAALILPMYYWADATLTLLRRLLRGEKVWQAHRSHFYQQGARKLGSHAAVAGRIAMLNLLLVGLAVASTYSWQVAVAATGLALIATAGLCRHFAEAA